METNLNIKAVCKLTGVNQHTLRTWERRYGAITPHRSTGGHRFYTEQDVERLILLRQLLARGLGIGALAQRSDAELTAQLHQTMALEADSSTEGPIVRDTRLPQAAMLASVVSALHAYDLARVYQLIHDARLRLGARDFALELILPLMTAVGRMIYEDKLTIAQEHALSAIIKSHLTSILFAMCAPRSSASTKGRIALATMEGDLHEIGILVSGILCAHHGFHVQYIGPNMPPAPLGSAMQAMQSDLLIIGMTPLPPELTRWTPGEYSQELCRELNNDQQVWFGGRAADPLPISLAKHRWRHFNTVAELDDALASGISGAAN